jgi:tRNA threonylcarbamoyladenosine biosynthesis protein TsaB
MNILAIDTAASVLSVALSTEQGSYLYEVDAGSRHSELLMDCVDTLVKSAGLHPGDFRLVACMKGPGSFTGLRIGFSAAKGIALALGIPITAIPSLDCMAAPLSIWPGIVVPAIDAKKGRFYTALYQAGQRMGDYQDIGVEPLSAIINRNFAELPIAVTGPGGDILVSLMASFIPRERIFLDPGYRKGRGIELLEIAKKISMFDNGNGEFNSGPLYLRKSDAELNLNS